MKNNFFCDDAYNIKIAHDLTLVAEKEINIGDEIYGNYNFDGGDSACYLICYMLYVIIK